MDLLRLYLVNILRPVVEDPKLSEQDDDDEDDDDDDDDEGEDEDDVLEHGLDEDEGRPVVVVGGREEQDRDRDRARPTMRRRRSRQRKSSSRSDKGGFKSIELLDSSGPKLIHGIQRWFVLYQIIGQLNWLEKPLIFSIIYKSILIPVCVNIVYKDMLKSISASRITDEFKNPIFVFISLSAAATIILLATLTFYNNLFNWCPLFKVLTTERLCFVRREVQDIIGNNTLPPFLCFYAFICVLFRMLSAKDFQEFINTFDIIDYVKDLFVFLCVGYHLVGMCYTDFYIRICFGVWIIAMKTNLENRFAYLQKHQRVKQRSSLRDRLTRVNINVGSGSGRGGGGTSSVGVSGITHRKATSSSMVTNFSTSSANTSILKNDQDLAQDLSGGGTDYQETNFEVLSEDSIATATTLNNTTGTGTAGAGEPNQKQQFGGLSNSGANGNNNNNSYTANHMTLDDFKAKYKIETMDEIQKNLNTMDDHLEVSRDFQNSSLVLITLSAFLTNGALLLLAYNLLANQGDYYHGFIIVLIAGTYTITIFMCYIGDSWLLYALESFVQTVEDEYFLQSANDDVDHDNSDTRSKGTTASETTNQTAVVPSTTGGTGASTNNEQQTAADWSTGAGVVSEIGSESTPYSELIRQHHQLFIIKKRDVLFCREFLNQFQNHLATPWSKLTVKVQLHMLRTFVTLIAAQIIFDREH